MQKNPIETINNETIGNFSDINISKIEMGTPLKEDRNPQRNMNSNKKNEPLFSLDESPIKNVGIFTNQDEPVIALSKSVQGSYVASNDNTSRTNTSSTESKLYDDMMALDNDTKIIKKFFHDLLLYINRNNCTLENDVDGEIENFVNQIPANELDMDFQTWILDKVTKVKVDFRKAVQKKINLVSKKIESQKHYIDNIATDEELIEMVKNLEI